jgi:Effector Associated Constant Component 1
VGGLERPAKLGVQVMVGSDDDAEEVAKATLQLRRELLDLDVDAVELPPAGEPPPGTRAVELAALGALVVAIGKSQLLANVVAAVQSWLAGSPQRRSIKLELDGDVLELTGVSSKEQRRLTNEWLARHAGR